MKRKFPLIFGILICILVMGIAYVWATELMDSMYAYRSPFQFSAPKPGETVGNPITRSVVIVLIDGLRYDTSEEPDVMPFLNQLSDEGANALMRSRPPSYSEPGYTVLLTGAWPDLSDGPVINVDYSEIPGFTQDDIYSATQRAGMLTAVSGYYWFEKLIPQEAVTASFYTPGEDQEADREVVDAALPWIREGKYGLVLIHLDQIDYAGHHEGGPIDPRWDAAASRVDGLLEEIATAMNLNQDTLLVISDHGHIDKGGHGGQDPIVLMEPFVMIGNGVIPGSYGDVNMVDVAPTIAALLGTNIPATNQGQPKVEMLNISLEQVDDINLALSNQQGQLAVAYETAIGEPVLVQNDADVVSNTQEGMDAAKESRLNNERLPRGLIAIIFGVLIINLVIWYDRPYVWWILLGGLSYLLAFNIKYILIDHKTYSLSSVTDATSLITGTAITSSLALLIGWIMLLLGTKSYHFRPFKSANITMKYILTTLSLISIPIFINYAVNGALVTWTLPDFFTAFLGLIFLIQALVVAAIGLILVGFSGLIGLFADKKSVGQEM